MKQTRSQEILLAFKSYKTQNSAEYESRNSNQLKISNESEKLKDNNNGVRSIDKNFGRKPTKWKNVWGIEKYWNVYFSIYTIYCLRCLRLSFRFTFWF